MVETENMPSISDAISAPDSTQANVGVENTSENTRSQNKFSQQLAQYQSVYTCFVEEMLKSQSEIADTAEKNLMTEERERLNRMESRLHEIASKMAKDLGSSNDKSQALQKQLDDAHARHKKEQERAAKEHTKSNISPENQALSNLEKSAHDELRHLSSYAGQQISSQAYARLFYTRLLFWIIMSIMLLIVLFRAATSNAPGALLNIIGVVIGLGLIYYFLGFVYNRVF